MRTRQTLCILVGVCAGIGGRSQSPTASSPSQVNIQTQPNGIVISPTSLIPLGIAVVCVIFVGGVVWRVATDRKGLDGNLTTLKLETKAQLDKIETSMTHLKELIGLELKAHRGDIDEIFRHINRIEGNISKLNGRFDAVRSIVNTKYPDAQLKPVVLEVKDDE